MTQFEFENELRKLNLLEQEEKHDLIVEMDEIDSEKRMIADELMELKNKQKELGCDMECKYLKISTLKDRKASVLMKIKAVNTKYSSMKRQFIMENRQYINIPDAPGTIIEEYGD